MRSLREPEALTIQPMRYRSDKNMAEILSKRRQQNRFQVVHSTSARRFDDGQDHTFQEFLEILRTGKDFDRLHRNCSDTVTMNCFPTNPPNPPFDGDLLQIMPWPNFQDLTDHDIRAIYEYLKAIPCIQGNYPGPSGPGAGIPPEPEDRCSEFASHKLDV